MKDRAERKCAVMRSSEEGWLNVFCPFNKMWIDYLKSTIAPQDRKPVINDLGKFSHWSVREQYLDNVVSLLQDYFPGEEITSDLVSESADWVTGMFLACPEKHRDRVFRALAMAFHPDTGGNAKTMERINEEYQRLKATR